MSHILSQPFNHTAANCCSFPISVHYFSSPLTSYYGTMVYARIFLYCFSAWRRSIPLVYVWQHARSSDWIPCSYPCVCSVYKALFKFSLSIRFGWWLLLKKKKASSLLRMNPTALWHIRTLWYLTVKQWWKTTFTSVNEQVYDKTIRSVW